MNGISIEEVDERVTTMILARIDADDDGSPGLTGCTFSGRSEKSEGRRKLQKSFGSNSPWPTPRVKTGTYI
jgi:hypothetical protein